MQLIRSYFPELTPLQIERYREMQKLIPGLNQQVNVISRKDIGSLEERHILHSLSIARKFSFHPGCSVIDAGTGGGFPGIPLAIYFPEVRFTLVDSIGKKIRLVQELAGMIGLENVSAVHSRVENMEQKADFVVSRAVTHFSKLHQWTAPLIRSGKRSNLPNGLISLKGGDLQQELQPFSNRIEIFPISQWFREPFFSTKMIVYLKK
ncbi:MAG: 16S rRNA (guanine(527)-N(7))-methyltransferase RsmG [Bacteroidales bacterium]